MSLIISPILTEKAALGMDRGLYVMTVDRGATKNSITTEMKKLFDLDVLSVRIVNLPAKRVKFKRLPGVQTARRKAYVQLRQGQKLPGFELPKQKEDKSSKEPAKENE
ncbi:MAG: 50S ribosomal protein L23 [Candidatus Berkelbacteria bacterium]|nr:50S ribosomal protein L23 [Candidatus Berkelbacteria bacterium]MCR4307595.1 50S ribosomal protein L23 [Candidatus Berkelbacteria bacterium]